jgi:hydroxypyruvate reductase
MPLGGSASDLIRLRAQAVELFREGVAASDPEGAVASALKTRTETIAAARRVILVAFGKAACPMARAALPFVGDKLHTACAVTNRENLVEVAGVEVIAGGHPLPEEGSVRGADAIESAARSARPGDLLLVLVSGGGSALTCAPAQGVPLADKIALNEALIRSGADITEINAVRQSFSRLKGGRLAQLASGARVLSLILSDVPGDDVATIASGPTARPSTCVADAKAILERYDLVRTLSPTLREYLDDPAARTQPDAEYFDHVENVVIGSNAISLQRVMSSAGSHYPVVVKADDWLDGDVSEAAATLHRLAVFAARQEGPVAIVAGGEPTVRVRGSGRGGRNQELALRFALLNERTSIRRPWVFLSGGTDGRDGPTDAAGGLVDAGSTSWMRQLGCSPEDYLDNNDSYRALALSGDLLMTGPTGTNVADLQILLMH